MSEQADELKKRTYQFTLDVIELTKTFPTVEPGPTIKRQLLKATTSVGANYRAACWARSHADFTSKIGVVAIFSRQVGTARLNEQRRRSEG